MESRSLLPAHAGGPLAEELNCSSHTRPPFPVRVPQPRCQGAMQLALQCTGPPCHSLAVTQCPGEEAGPSACSRTSAAGGTMKALQLGSPRTPNAHKTAWNLSWLASACHPMPLPRHWHTGPTRAHVYQPHSACTHCCEHLARAPGRLASTRCWLLQHASLPALCFHPQPVNTGGAPCIGVVCVWRMVSLALADTPPSLPPLHRSMLCAQRNHCVPGTGSSATSNHPPSWPPATRQWYRWVPTSQPWQGLPPSRSHNGQSGGLQCCFRSQSPGTRLPPRACPQWSYRRTLNPWHSTWPLLHKPAAVAAPTPCLGGWPSVKPHGTGFGCGCWALHLALHQEHAASLVVDGTTVALHRLTTHCNHTSFPR